MRSKLFEAQNSSSSMADSIAPPRVHITQHSMQWLLSSLSMTVIHETFGTLEAAVHRDLVKTGQWPAALGRDYSFCAEARGVGDYGTDVRMDAAQATEALDASHRILRAVHGAMPATFAAPPGDDKNKVPEAP